MDPRRPTIVRPCDLILPHSHLLASELPYLGARYDAARGYVHDQAELWKERSSWAWNPVWSLKDYPQSGYSTTPAGYFPRSELDPPGWRVKKVAEFDEHIKHLLRDNHQVRRSKGLPAPKYIHHWTEEAYQIRHHHNRFDCPCQRCLYQRLLRKLEWHFNVNLPTDFVPRSQRLQRYPPDNSHPHFSLFLQLWAVVRKYSRRLVDLEEPHPAWALHPCIRRKVNIFRWTKDESLCDEGDSETEEESEATQVARVRKRNQQQQQKSKSKRKAAAASNKRTTHGKSNALPGKMETTTTIATAPTAPHQLSAHSQHFSPMTMTPHPSQAHPSPPAAPPLMAEQPPAAPPPPPPSIPTNDPRPASWLDTPAADKRIDHALPSNLRDSVGNTLDEPTTNDNGAAFADLDLSKNIFDDHLPYNDESATLPSLAKQNTLDMDDFDLKNPTTPSNDTTTNYAETTTADDTNQGNDEEETGDSLAAYAMLRFPDSYCLITSMNLVIVRDESYRARYLMQKKESKKRRKAEQALNEYAREPSHHSLRGDDDDAGPLGIGDDDDLEGRPARGLLSNFSEQGGPVSYPADSEDEADFEAERARRRRRKNKANSSSANSIAPQDLSIFGGNGDEGEFLPTENVLDENGVTRDPREWAQLPVHTARPEDIGKISREHLIFSYDMNRQRWVLNVTGRGVVVNAIFYPRGSEAIELNHQDEIFVSTVRMIFELPNKQDEESPAETDEDFASRYGLASTSPVRRLSNAFDVADSEGEEAEEEPQPRAPKPVKIKLTNKKKDPAKEAPAPGKGKGKNKGKTIEQPAKAEGGKAKSKTEASGSPEVSKKPEKGKKPKPASADASGDIPAEGSEQPKAESTAPPVVIDPGSVLADLAPEQMPEKRKGPGRPPKNGLLSKRDESAIKRKQREYERRGEQAPELQTLLNIVRAEQRAKDLAAKAQARGEPAPDTPIPSIETDLRNEAGPSTAHRDSLAGTAGSPPNGADRASPRPIRRPKSPSPIKPESEFTEEEMKKPNMTYIYIIDEILQNMEGSQADLQTIYDKIQKRWPYYKYRVNSVGWQSSVRHNLLQCDRFKEAGKSGKGRFWTINFDHPLDNKKKRPTPPPRPPPQHGQMPHGLPHMQQNQFTQYPAQYGQNQMNGQGQYAQGPPGQGQFYNSPYPHNYGPGPQRPPSNGPYMQQGHAHPPQQRPPPPPQPAPAPAPVPFQRVVDAIVAYRTGFLQQFPMNTPAYLENETQLNRAIQYYSDLFHGKPDDGSVSEEEAGKEPFRALKAIFDEHKDLTTAANTAPATAPPNGPNQQAPLPPASAALPVNGANQQAMPPPINTPSQQPTPANGQSQPSPPAANAPIQQPLPANAQGQQQTPPAANAPSGPYPQPPPPMPNGQSQQGPPPPPVNGNFAPSPHPPNAPSNQSGAVHTSATAQSGSQAPSQAAVPHAHPQPPTTNAGSTNMPPPSSKPATPQPSTAQPAPVMQSPVAPQQPRPIVVADQPLPAASNAANGNALPATSTANSGPQTSGSQVYPAQQPSPTQPAAGPVVGVQPQPSAQTVGNVENKAAAAVPALSNAPAAVNGMSGEATQKQTTPTEAPQVSGVKRPADDGSSVDTEEQEAKRQKTS